MDQTVDTTKTAYHHGDLRQALIAAARQLIEEKGPDNFSVAEAARLAGVSSAAPYKHFADKEEMKLAVCMQAMDEKYDLFVNAVKDLPERSPERISAIGRAYISTAINEPNVFRMTFGLASTHGEIEEAVEQGKRLFGLVVQEVAGLIGRENVSADAGRRAFMLWSFVHGLSFLLIDGKVSAMGLEVDIEAMLTDVGTRILSDLPAAS